jgi:flagellar motor protein MotB
MKSPGFDFDLLENSEHEGSGHENGELWLVSYADLMTLLFGFFVMMYSDADRTKEIEKTFSAERAPALTDTKETSIENASPRNEEALAQAMQARIKELEVEVKDLKGSLEVKSIEARDSQEEAKALSAKLAESHTKLDFGAKKDSQADRISKNAMMEEARLLFRTPCRMCIHFGSTSRDVGEMISSDNGVVATHVTRGGPAELAGIRSGDVIEKIDGRRPREGFQFENLPLGKEVEVELKRFGKPLTLKVSLDALGPEAKKKIEGEAALPVEGVGKFSVSGIGLRERITHYIPSEVEGVLIVTPCRSCGFSAWMLSEGDVILSINGEPVTSPTQLQQIWLGKAVVEVWRHRNRDFELLALTPG